MYEPRTYRKWARSDSLIPFNVIVKETDLCIWARRNLRGKALKSVSKYRASLEGYIYRHPSFLTSLEPYPACDAAPDIIKEMASASAQVSIGPMAAVAGAIAEYVGIELLAYSPEIIIENGGDIFLKVAETKRIAIYAGESPLSGKIALEIDPDQTPLGVCTSSGTVGHSLSFGKADAAIVVAPSTALADATATAVGNMVKSTADINEAIEFAKSIDQIKGVVIIKDDQMGMWGDIRIAEA